MMTQQQLVQFAVDDSEGFFKIISLDKVKYLLKTNLIAGKEEKTLGTLNRLRRYYITFRRRYVDILSNQKQGFPNWDRHNKALQLGIRDQKDGHYFDKFKGYGISAKVLDDLAPYDLVVFVEQVYNTQQIRLLVIDKGSVLKCKMWRDRSNGRLDMQYIIPEILMDVVAESKLENIKITQAV